jgi:ubiquinone/menaquinone biosynthesis C-methylase UbiE
VSDAPVFDQIAWRDPVSGARLVPQVAARTPAGVPISGALRVEGTSHGYPIFDCIARVTPELAQRHSRWLEPLGLVPPLSASGATDFQPEETVESFGWQWTWNSQMRTDVDLEMRVAHKFGVDPGFYAGKLVADMGAGAGDQSAYLVRQGARVVSVDLSAAIEVVARKLRMNSTWFGVQADITRLPFAAAAFDCIYCEGVIQHTRDSALAVRELARVARPGGHVLAAHYVRTVPAASWARMKRRVSQGLYERVRTRLSRMERFKLLLLTGNLAALSYVPLVGALVRRSGLALRYDLMPGFKTTWTNTFDYYGNHSFQRFMSRDEFAALFAGADGMIVERENEGNIRARKGC